MKERMQEGRKVRRKDQQKAVRKRTEGKRRIEGRWDKEGR